MRTRCKKDLCTNLHIKLGRRNKFIASRCNEAADCKQRMKGVIAVHVKWSVSRLNIEAHAICSDKLTECLTSEWMANIPSKCWKNKRVEFNWRNKQRRIQIKGAKKKQRQTICTYVSFCMLRRQELRSQTVAIFFYSFWLSDLSVMINHFDTASVYFILWAVQKKNQLEVHKHRETDIRGNNAT